MRRRGVGLLVLGSMAWLGVACSDDQGPSEPPLVVEKPATKSGDNQTGPVGIALGNPLRILITRDGEPVEGVGVNWSAAQGGAIGDAVESDELGIATAVWTLGPEEVTQVTTETVEGATNSPLTYSATAESGDKAVQLAVVGPPWNQNRSVLAAFERAVARTQIELREVRRSVVARPTGRLEDRFDVFFE